MRILVHRSLIASLGYATSLHVADKERLQQDIVSRGGLMIL
jgi:hypothetical protein